jgi:hypothetical protein
MSALSTIVTALETQIQTTLGASWVELDYVYDLDKNDARRAQLGWGVAIGSSNTATGPTKAVTYDQTVSVILAKKYTPRSSDESQKSIVLDLVTKKELLDIEIFQKKINTSDVLLVQEIGMDEPVTTNDNIVFLRFNYIVKYRNQTS